MTGFDYGAVMEGIASAQADLDRLVAAGDMEGARALMKAYPFDENELDIELSRRRARTAAPADEPQRIKAAETFVSPIIKGVVNAVAKKFAKLEEELRTEREARETSDQLIEDLERRLAALEAKR